MIYEIKLHAPGIDLQSTLIDSAQCFCWHEAPDCHWAVLRAGAEEPAAFYVYAEADGLRIESDAPLNEAFWHDYFDCDRDYAALPQKFGWHQKMAEALRAAEGLRVLRQPAWDTVLSFILSANNNVGRIRTLVAALAQNFGTPVQTRCGLAHAIPTAQQLSRAAETELRALGCGYRAPYLVETSAAVAGSFDLDALRNVPYEEAHQALTWLKGVGDKVADCICLFGLQHSCAFPVDVWVERLLISWFGMPKQSRRAMSKRAMEMLGEDAGIIQQYLFHCARLGLLGELK